MDYFGCRIVGDLKAELVNVSWGDGKSKTQERRRRKQSKEVSGVSLPPLLVYGGSEQKLLVLLVVCGNGGMYVWRCGVAGS